MLRDWGWHGMFYTRLLFCFFSLAPATGSVLRHDKRRLDDDLQPHEHPFHPRPHVPEGAAKGRLLCIRKGTQCFVVNYAFAFVIADCTCASHCRIPNRCVFPSTGHHVGFNGQMCVKLMLPLAALSSDVSSMR